MRRMALMNLTIREDNDLNQLVESMIDYKNNKVDIAITFETPHSERLFLDSYEGLAQRLHEKGYCIESEEMLGKGKIYGINLLH
jgi:hypothetical protein